MTGSGSDRRGFMKGAAVTAAAVGAGALAPGAAEAAQPDPGIGDLGALLGGLPPVGVDIPCSCYAANVPLKLNIMNIVSLDFKGGINVCVRTSKVDGIILEIQGHRVEADLNPTQPNSGTIIVITMSNVTLTPLSVITSAGLALLKLSLTISTVDKATGVETVIASTDPSKYAELVSTDAAGNEAPVKAFPPVNQNYALKEAVQLYKPGTTAAEGEPIGVLEGFGVVVNHA
jgi:hypothetical protein